MPRTPATNASGSSIPRFRHKVPGQVFVAKGVRLKGQKWSNLRNRWLRWNPTCNRCGRPGEEVHHLVPRALRPDLMYDLDNLETLCKSCHLLEHAEKPRS